MAPSQRRGPWVPEEDQTLLQLVRSQGPNNWVRISQHMQYRSPKQCRERFHQNLKPTLNHEPISAEEGLMIERMVNEMGKRWAEIARRLGNRSDNAVKNWWNGSMNRKRRGLILPGGGNHSSRTLNGRVEPPYPKISMSMRGSPGRLHYQDASYGTRRPSWASISERDQGESSASSIRHQQLPGRLHYSQAEARDRRDHISPAEYEFGSQYPWPRPSPLSHQSPIRTHRQLSPIVTYTPSLHSMTSPSTSERSNPTSAGPPSLISDHTSISSASPRTAASPSILSTPIDIHSMQDDRRRGSAPALRSHPSHEESYYGVPCAKNVDAIRRWAPDIPTYSQEPPHHHWKHQHSNSAPHHRLDPITDSRVQASSPPRDSRMGLQSLLN
ncbi:hypothetical protein FQN51_007711 [Onygenales sp. PD_10]|nr:hypothetical protein FQN51_007711 [Onygenales sp. PD_10]